MNLSLCIKKRSASLFSIFAKIASRGVSYQKPCTDVNCDESACSSAAIKSSKLYTALKMQPDARLLLTPMRNYETNRTTLTFSPYSIGLTSILSSFHVNNISKELPFPSNIRTTFILPPCFESLEKTDNRDHASLEMPPQQGIYEKHAARLIVIRKRKMKKHKLQKLRKKMKFEWAKVRQRREMRKEKAFQAVLIMQIKEAEKFDAAQYVADKLEKAQEVRIPRTLKGKRLPEFLIKEKLGIK